VREAERLRDRLTALGDLEGAQQAELLAAWGLFSSGMAEECLSRSQAVLDAASTPQSIATVARQQCGIAAVFGPMPADEALQLLERSNAGTNTYPGAALGASRMLSAQGRFAEASALLAQTTETMAEWGDRLLISLAREVAGDLSLLSGDIKEALRQLQHSYDEKVATGDRGFASTTAAALAEAYLENQDLAQAWEYGTIARQTSARDDIASQAGGRQIQARVLSARGQDAEAEVLGREAVAMMERTDYFQFHAHALVHLARVLQAAGKADEAVAAARQAVEFYAAKGATFFVERTERLIDNWSR
jgi:tetratricopeptide (TPR) repeat protein